MWLFKQYRIETINLTIFILYLILFALGDPKHLYYYPYNPYIIVWLVHISILFVISFIQWLRHKSHAKNYLVSSVLVIIMGISMGING